MKKYFLLIALSLLGFTSIKAETPRAEYPRPQFERAQWLNLNGTWTYTFDFGKSGNNRDFKNSKGFDGKILVPFCPESKLSGVEYTDFINCMWYQRTITVPSDWEGKQVLLHFGAVDYEATIYIDGKEVMQHFGTGSSFDINITKYVPAGKSANLVVRVEDNLRSGMQPGGKQCWNYFSGGCDYTRTTGIWQTVWMEPVSPQGLKNVFAIPDIEQQQLVVRPEFYGEANGNTLTIQVFDGKKVVSTKTANAVNGANFVLPIKNPKLWSPETPNLYDVRYTVKDASGKVIDEVSSYAGMRKIHCANGYFYLNNQPYFQRLVLDQGFYPEGIWTAPTDAALRHDQLKSGVILAHQIKALKMVATIPMACCACDHFFGLIVDHTAGSLKHTLLVVIPEKHLDIGQTVLFQRPIHHLKKAFLFLSCEHTGIPGLPGFWLILE